MSSWSMEIGRIWNWKLLKVKASRKLKFATFIFSFLKLLQTIYLHSYHILRTGNFLCLYDVAGLTYWSLNMQLGGYFKNIDADTVWHRFDMIPWLLHPAVPPGWDSCPREANIKDCFAYFWLFYYENDNRTFQKHTIIDKRHLKWKKQRLKCNWKL